MRIGSAHHRLNALPAVATFSQLTLVIPCVRPARLETKAWLARFDTLRRVRHCLVMFHNADPV